MNAADAERAVLVREIQACDVRLGLLPPEGQESRHETFREELLHRREAAAQRLAQLEPAADAD